MKKQLIIGAVALSLLLWGYKPQKIHAETSEPTIEKQVIFQQDGITITTTGIDMNGSYMGPNIKLLIENDTEKNITVQSRNVSVNGYMVETIMSSDVTSGKKVNDDITILNNSMKKCGINDIAYVDFGLHIFNSDSYLDFIDTEMIHLDTSHVNVYSQVYDDSGENIYEDEHVKIVSKGLTNDSILGPGIKLYIENKTNECITVQSRDTSVDGFMVNTIFSPDIDCGKKAISSITIMNSDIEKNGLTDLQNAETSFHIFKTKGFNTIVDTKPVSIKLK